MHREGLPALNSEPMVRRPTPEPARSLGFRQHGEVHLPPKQPQYRNALTPWLLLWMANFLMLVSNRGASEKYTW